MLVRIAKKLLPKDSPGFKVARVVARKLGVIAPVYVDGRYNDWVHSAEALYWEPYKKLAYQPLISIIVPVFNVPENFLKEAVFSVVNQTYDNWELVLVNASTNAKCRRYTTKCAQIDRRIRIVELDKNLGIGENTNRGIAECKGEYIALLDHDDTLARQALYEVARCLQGKEKPGLVYSDEDKLTPKSEYRYDPHFKPDWSPHLLRQVNYLNHFTVIEKRLAEKVGLYRRGFDGAQDYDFYLRLTDETALISHVPKILYHWRAAPTSTAADFSSKKNILDAGIRALEGHLERRKLAGSVRSVEKQPGFYQIDYARDTTVPVAVVICGSPASHQYAAYVRQVVAMLAPETGKVEIFADGMKGNQKYLAAHEDVLTNITGMTTAAQFLKKVLATSKAKAFIVIDAAVLWEDNDWLYRLAGYVEACADVAIASPLLVDKFGKRIVDAGLVRQGRQLVPLFAGYPMGAHTFFGSTVWTRSIDQSYGRVMALTRSSLEQYLVAGKTAAAACDMAYEKGKCVLLVPDVTLKFVGDFHVPAAAAPRFSPVFGLTHYEFGFTPGVHFNPSGDDNA